MSLKEATDILDYIENNQHLLETTMNPTNLRKEIEEATQQVELAKKLSDREGVEHYSKTLRNLKMLLALVVAYKDKTISSVDFDIIIKE